jgi:hypothetical protein
MSTPLIILCIVIYLATAWSLYGQGQLGLGFMFAMYALANIGIIFASKGY